MKSGASGLYICGAPVSLTISNGETSMKKRPVKKAGATKKTTAKKGGSTKPATKRPASKRTSRPKQEPRAYVMPKTAAELGIVCRSPAFNAAGICGAAVVWFDYELGEKNHMQGFVCDEHRISDRVEKLAQPKTAIVV
jgi:hypothetical protein